MSSDAELKQVYALASLDDFVLELGADVGAFFEKLRTTPRLLIGKEDGKVVIDVRFGSQIAESSPLCLHHEDYEYEIAHHVDD